MRCTGFLTYYIPFGAHSFCGFCDVLRCLGRWRAFLGGLSILFLWNQRSDGQKVKVGEQSILRDPGKWKAVQGEGRRMEGYWCGRLRAQLLPLLTQLPPCTFSTGSPGHVISVGLIGQLRGKKEGTDRGRVRKGRDQRRGSMGKGGGCFSLWG